MMPLRKRWPLAYLITIRTYGTWLHGDPRGSTTDAINEFGAPHLPGDLEVLEASRQRLRQPPYSMDKVRREIVLRSIVNACEFRNWQLFAAHIRSEHAHAIVGASLDPKVVIRVWKARSTLRLNQSCLDPAGRRYWAAGGSKVYLWTPSQVREKIRYVLEEQGEPMQVAGSSPLRSG